MTTKDIERIRSRISADAEKWFLAHPSIELTELSNVTYVGGFLDGMAYSREVGNSPKDPRTDAREIEREAFERWYCKGDDVMTFVPWDNTLDQPEDFVANMAWEAWLAAKESQLAALADKDAENTILKADIVMLCADVEIAEKKIETLDRDYGRQIQQQAAEIERLSEIITNKNQSVSMLESRVRDRNEQIEQQAAEIERLNLECELYFHFGPYEKELMKNPTAQAARPLVPESWRFGYNGLGFGFMDNGPFIAYECYEEAAKQIEQLQAQLNYLQSDFIMVDKQDFYDLSSRAHWLNSELDRIHDENNPDKSELQSTTPEAE